VCATADGELALLVERAHIAGWPADVTELVT
jgi:hypothetical protein